MTWVLIGVGAAAMCFLVALAIGLTDELRQPPSNIRRMGVGLALVAGFAGIWLLITPLRTADGQGCPAPAMVLTEYDAPPVKPIDGCADQMRLNTVLGLIAAGVAPVSVIATRLHRD